LRIAIVSPLRFTSVYVITTKLFQALKKENFDGENYEHERF